jgi:hypothetical protein
VQSEEEEQIIPAAIEWQGFFVCYYRIRIETNKK